MSIWHCADISYSTHLVGTLLSWVKPNPSQIYRKSRSMSAPPLKIVEAFGERHVETEDRQLLVQRRRASVFGKG